MKLEVNKEFYEDKKLGLVPVGWTVSKIQEVFHINQKTLTAKTKPDYSFNYITIESVSIEHIDLSLVERLQFKTSPSRARRIIEKGDVLISTVRPNLKSFVRFNFNETDWICSTGFNVLSVKENQDSNFYFYQLLSFIGEKQFASLVAGTNYPAINDRDFQNIKVFVAPPDEQKAIASIINKVDKAITATKTSIVKAERLKKSLMQNLLSGKLKADGSWRKEKEFSYDEKVGHYPTEWNCNRFKEFSVLQRGKDLTDAEVVTGIYPVVKSNGTTIHHNHFTCEPPGVVTGRSGTIGKVFFVEENFWAHNTTLYIKDFKGNFEKFIFFLIQTMRFEKYYAGTTVPTLNRNDVHKVRVAIPKSVGEQKEICKLIDNAESILQSKQTKIKKLERLKKALMQNLLTGKVRVKIPKLQTQ